MAHFAISSAVIGVAAVVCLAAASPRLGAQDGAIASPPAFEAASVKLNRTGERTRNTILPGGRYSATNVPLRMMIRSAYAIQDFQLIGGPAWLNTDGYDVVATAGTDAPPDRLFAMVRRLLEDRFGLAAHRETRSLPILALIRLDPGRLGKQLRASEADCTGPPAAPGRPPRCGILMNFGEIRGTGASLAQLATSVAPFAGRAVQDRTGLAGLFDFELQFTPEVGGSPTTGAQPPVPSVDRPSLFTAVQEQLGLKLESTTAPIEVLVIDRVERPAED